MKVKEAIELINNSEEKLYSIYDAEFLIKYKKILATNVNLEYYVGYTTSTSYYQLEDGILGIKGVSRLFNENGCTSDYNIQCHAFEGEEYTTVSYKPKSK